MTANLRVVDDTQFVIGLCEMFRQSMAPFEASVVLPLAEEACRVLGVAPLAVPVEGYYSDSVALARLFRLVRALQSVELRDRAEPPGPVARLRKIYDSPAFGRPSRQGTMLPRL